MNPRETPTADPIYNSDGARRHIGFASGMKHITMNAPDLRSLCAVFIGIVLFVPSEIGSAQQVQVPRGRAKATIKSLSRAEALTDLESFGKRLREEAAYIELRRSSPFEAIESLKQRLPATVNTAEFTRELQKIIAPIGDCHSSVSSKALDDEPGLWLPFRLAIADGGVIAVTRENTSFVEAGFPYLVAIDGKPLKTWLAAARKYEPFGSATQNLYASVDGIRRLDVLRRDLGLAARNDVALTFADTSGKTKEATLPCRGRFSSPAKIQIGESRRLGDIAYLRLPEMDDKLISVAKRRMEEFRDSAGLIVDVRGNGGGTYGLMRTLFGYFRPADAGPFVCNIAAYRLAPRFKENHIEYRPTFRRDWTGWSPQDLAAIDATMKSFKPAFTLPAGQFSDWHFMLLRHEDFQFHYDKPVIVLCDESCISATDGFLAAFAELPKVTLMGVGSRGGSGSSRTVTLPRSGIAFKLSTMASFRPNGDTFEGKGIAVDVAAQPPPDDFITGKDSVLAQAVQRLTATR